MDQQHRQEPPKDPSLDVPAEANRGKHINYTEEEGAQHARAHVGPDSDANDRRDQWERGLREGRESVENESDK
jgi:hypothetical protein